MYINGHQCHVLQSVVPDSQAKWHRKDIGKHGNSLRSIMRYFVLRSAFALPVEIYHTSCTIEQMNVQLLPLPTLFMLKYSEAALVAMPKTPH